MANKLEFVDDQDWEKLIEKEQNHIVEDLTSEILKENSSIFTNRKLGEALELSEISKVIKNCVMARKDLVPTEKEIISQQILAHATGYGQIAEFFTGKGAEEITEVLVNPTHEGPKVFYGKHGRSHYAGNDYFKTDTEVEQFVRMTCEKAGRPFNADNPIVDAWLPDGSRLAAFGFKASPLGTAFTIRKSPVTREPLPLSAMVANGTFPPFFADIAQNLLVPGKCNMAVCGRTDSGKTTILRALALFIAPMDRTIIGETSFELYVPTLKNCLNMTTVKIAGKDIITMNDVCDSMNRNNPDRSIVSEIRGGEIVAASEIAESTSGGFWTTAHAGGILQLRSRFPKMFARGGMNLSPDMVDNQIASMFHYIIFVDKDANGKRTFMELIEVSDKGTYQTILRFDKEKYAQTNGKERRWIYENPFSPSRLADLSFRGATIKPEFEQIKEKYLYPEVSENVG